MKKIEKGLLTALFCALSISGYAQVITLDPAFPTAEDSVVVQFDASKGNAGLQGFDGEVYAHTGVLTSASTSNSDWKYVKTEWGENTDDTRLTRIDGDLYEITIGPSIRSYYGVPESETITHITFVFRSADTSREGKDTGGADILAEVLNEAFAMTLELPDGQSVFVDEGGAVTIQATASEAADFTLEVNGVEIGEGAQSEVTEYSYELQVQETSGSHEVALTATAGENVVTKSFTYTLRTATTQEPLPTGIIKGINYDEGDATRATLCLLAPGKSSVYALGDFNDWEIRADYQLKQDGEYFWLVLEDLEPGTEYAFQYLVDESIYVADPYTNKILDKNNDPFIPSSIYPDLKGYPEGAENVIGEYNVVSVLQTDQSDYLWQNDFQKPDPSELVIYELLIRDFFGNGRESYANLIDTLSYIKSLGVNAIELMPITEFSGNDSWGYNPTFMFAADKAYGPKDELKRFIDAAHGLGMAVILDVVLNHQDQPSPIVLMDYDLDRNIPTADNPYFNQTAAHPFNVFFDMNHESAYTKSFVDSVNHYWINEYRFDGYRFDLSKGFTQRRNTDVGAWSAYDGTRIAILKRMADAIWEHTPDAYVMLEHFADNVEETELANYGMLLWGNSHGAFKQNILGYAEDSDFSWIYHGSRDWENPHVIGYMESHDEQRQMYEALQFGNSSGDYNVKEIGTALPRMEAAFAFLMTIPGPKLFWQFGEMGYDIDIEFNGRTGQKPTPWDESEGYPYYSDYARSVLRQKVAAIIDLRVSHDLFASGTAEIIGATTLYQTTIIRNEPYTDDPANASEMNAVVVANFDVVDVTTSAAFPHTGTWYDYFSDETFEVDGLSTPIPLAPGQYYLLTDVELERPEIVLDAQGPSSVSALTVFPNPTSDFLQVSSDWSEEPLYYALFDLSGRKVKTGKFSTAARPIDVSDLRGVHIVEIITRAGAAHYQRVIID